MNGADGMNPNLVVNVARARLAGAAWEKRTTRGGLTFYTRVERVRHVALDTVGHDKAYRVSPTRGGGWGAEYLDMYFWCAINPKEGDPGAADWRSFKTRKAAAEACRADYEAHMRDVNGADWAP